MATALSPASSPVSTPINFAKSFGFSSVPAAIAFAALYTPLLLFFIFKSFKQPGHVYIVMVIFCNIRLGAFVMRAFLAGSASAGQNLSLLIVDEVLLGVGYAGLLYSSYTLVLDRDLIHSKFTKASTSQPPHPLAHLIQNRLLIRIVLTVGVTLGVMASTRLNNPSHGTDSTTKSMHTIGIIILLVLTGLLALQALRLLHLEMNNALFSGYEAQLPMTSTDSVPTYTPTPDAHKKTRPSFGQSHGAYILCLLSAFLLVREIFSIITVNNSKRQNEEQLWYPFIALPELLAVILLVTPGIVPRRGDVPKSTQPNPLSLLMNRLFANRA